jgi:hypothetical protein
LTSFEIKKTEKVGFLMMNKEIKLRSVEGSERWGPEYKFACNWTIRMSEVFPEDKAGACGKN